MDIFEEMEKEKEIEKNYTELAIKQKKILKKSLTITFSIIGLLFLTIGLCDFIFDFGEGYVIGIVYSIIGPAFMLAGLLCFLFINTQKVMPYEKYKESMSSFNNNYPSQIQIQLLEKRIEALEEKIEKLSK